ELHVELVGTDRAADFAAAVAGGFGMPDSLRPIPANVVGRPGWSCYVAYQDAAPAGAGAPFVHERVGSLGFGPTLPELPGPRVPPTGSTVRAPGHPHRGSPPAGVPDRHHRDRRAPGGPPLQLVPEHPPSRLPRGRRPAQLPRSLNVSVRNARA